MFLNSTMRICKEKTALAAHKWSNPVLLDKNEFWVNAGFKGVFSSQLNLLWSKMAVPMKHACRIGRRVRKQHLGSWEMFSLSSNPLQAIRAGKRNNNTPTPMQVWEMTAPGPWREFCRSCKQKKLRTFFAFVIFPVSSKILSSLMESWCIVFVGIHFFFGQI